MYHQRSAIVLLLEQNVEFQYVFAPEVTHRMAQTVRQVLANAVVRLFAEDLQYRHPDYEQHTNPTRVTISDLIDNVFTRPMSASLIVWRADFNAYQRQWVLDTARALVHAHTHHEHRQLTLRRADAEAWLDAQSTGVRLTVLSRALTEATDHAARFTRTEPDHR